MIIYGINNNIGDGVRISIEETIGEGIINILGESVVVKIRESIGDGVGKSIVFLKIIAVYIRTSTGDIFSDTIGYCGGGESGTSIGDTFSATIGYCGGEESGTSIVKSIGEAIGDTIRDRFGDKIRVKPSEMGSGQASSR